MIQKSRIVIISVLGIVVALAGALFWKTQKPSPSDATKDFAKFEFFSAGSRGPAAAHAKKQRPSVVLFKVKDNATATQKEDLQRAMDRFGLKVQKKMVNGKVNLGQASMQNISEDELVQILKETDAVEFAETDDYVPLAYTPNDPNLNSQWHHTRVNSYNAWNSTMGANTVLTANCDTGVESSHQDLAANLVLPGYNTVDGSTNSSPVHPHGTITAGVMAAVADNGLGIAGVSPKVKVLPIRISNMSDGTSYFSAMADCITYAADRGAKVVNLSYSGSESYTIDTAAQYLRSKGGLLIMAAGNAGYDKTVDPDFASFVIVAATDQNNLRPSWSNYGTPIDIAAPGVDIFSTSVGNTYGWASGTSLSAPIVSGVAALIYSIKPDLTPAAVESFLFSTATRLGTGSNDVNFGNGLVNAEAAVNAAKASLTCNYPNWVQGKYYYAGDIVKYTDGKLYIAKYANPGYNPTVSTYYWAPYTCSSTSTTTTTTLQATTTTTTTTTLPPTTTTTTTTTTTLPPTTTTTSTTTTTLAGTCNYPNWVQGKYYYAGDIVKYTDGKFYIAKYNNPGYNPTISTYYWAPYACSSTPTTTTTTLPSTTTTTTSTTTTTLAGSAPLCSQVFAWSRNTSYPAGAHVRYNNSIYKALSANRRVTPGTNSSIWALATCR